MLPKKPCSVVSEGGGVGGGGGGRGHTGEILWVSLVMALPVLAVGDTVQVPGSGQQGLVPCRRNICHLTLVLLLVSFPNVDNCVCFQLHGTQMHTQTHTYRRRRWRDWGQKGNRRQKEFRGPILKNCEKKSAHLEVSICRISN